MTHNHDHDLDTIGDKMADRLNALDPAPTLPEDFNDRLRQKWLAERRVPPAPHGRPIIWRWLVRGGLAAGILLALALWSLLPHRHSTAVAWADVVEAMQRVKQFEAFVVSQDGDEFRSMDAYYRDPNTWRIHTRTTEDHASVAFGTPEGSGVFNIEDREWKNRSNGQLSPMFPDDFSQRVRERGLLDAMLALIFRGEVPDREPVPSMIGGADDSVEVFDVVQDPNRAWARIWVLRSSRLPIRIKVFYPRQNEVIRVGFDYSNPQPDAFFDIAYFEEQAKSFYNQRPRDFFNIGTAPIAGNAQSSVQVFEAEGITPPKLLEIVKNHRGEILLVTDDPENMSKTGGRLESEYHIELQDNWGNLYVRFYYQPMNNGKIYQYYEPVPFYTEGPEPQRLTLLYTAWSHHVGAPGPLGYDVVLSEETVDVPPPSVDQLPPGSWTDGEQMIFYRNQGYRQAMQSAWPPLESLETIDALLVESPDSGQLLNWKRRKLEQLATREEVIRFFEQDMLANELRRLADGGGFGRSMSFYLHYLIDHDRLGEALDLIDMGLEDYMARLAAASDPRQAEQIERTFSYNDLSDWAKLPAALEAARDNPLPRPAEVVASRDGYVYVFFAPPGESDAESDQRFTDLQWRVAFGSGYELVARNNIYIPEGDGMRLRGVLLALRGEGPRIDLVASRAVDTEGQRNAWPRIRVPLDLDVEVPAPAVATRADLDRRFSDVFEPDAWWYQQVGDDEKALRLYREAFAVPLDQRKKVFDDPRENRAYYNRERVTTGGRIADCLIEMGRLEEALAQLDDLEPLVPPVDDDPFHQRESQLGLIRAHRMGVANRFIELGRLDEARNLIDEADRDRPDFRGLDNLKQTRKTIGGTSAYLARYFAANQWVSVDRARYRLRQAESRIGD